MDSLVITHGKSHFMESVCEVSLGNGPEPLVIVLLHQFLYLMLRPQAIIGKMIVASGQGNMALAADLLCVETLPALAAELICLFGVGSHKRDESLVVDVLRQGFSR